MRYRPEIDGLRAVAVIPVVLFHSGVPYVKGGYVGVDVFFVISGFLITSIIFEEIKQGTFTVFGFYERRIRRIFPALFAVVLISSIVATALFIPSDLRDYAQSVFATAAFSSNILFWLEAGYFDAPTIAKPLLHTWSLAVEEQFYIVFPLLLVLIVRYAKRPPIVYLVAIAIVSLIGSAYGVVEVPSATFYLLPTRAWELLLGALLVFIPQSAALGRGAAAALSGMGIALIAFSVFAYDPKTTFPGFAALVPCAGAALVILSTSLLSTPVSRLLSWSPVVKIGLWSYSLYLWHWPIVVFGRYYLQRKFNLAEMILVMVLSLFMAWLSWRYVEKPFRGRRSGVSRRGVFVFGAACISVSLAFGLAGHLLHGFPDRLPAEARQLAAGALDRNPLRASCHSRDPARVRDGDLCDLGNIGDAAAPTFAVWGDSHALALMPALDRLAKVHHVHGRFASYTGCPPLLGVRTQNPAPNNKCLEFNAAMLSYLRTSRVAHVVLVARWSAYATGVPFEPQADDPPVIADDGTEKFSRSSNAEVLDRGLRRTLQALNEIGAEVSIVAEVPELPFLAPTALARLSLSGRGLDELNVNLDAHRQQQSAVFQIFSRSRERFSFDLIDPARVLCDAVSCVIQSDGRSLYYDHHHLSNYGAQYVAPTLEPIFREMNTPRSQPASR